MYLLWSLRIIEQNYINLQLAVILRRYSALQSHLFNTYRYKLTYLRVNFSMQQSAYYFDSTSTVLWNYFINARVSTLQCRLILFSFCTSKGQLILNREFFKSEFQIQFVGPCFKSFSQSCRGFRISNIEQMVSTWSRKEAGSFW